MISNYIPHFTGYIISYSCWDWNYTIPFLQEKYLLSTDSRSSLFQLSTWYYIHGLSVGKESNKYISIKTPQGEILYFIKSIYLPILTWILWAHHISNSKYLHCEPRAATTPSQLPLTVLESDITNATNDMQSAWHLSVLSLRTIRKQNKSTWMLYIYSKNGKRGKKPQMVYWPHKVYIYVLN